MPPLLNGEGIQMAVAVKRSDGQKCHLADVATLADTICEAIAELGYELVTVRHGLVERFATVATVNRARP